MTCRATENGIYIAPQLRYGLPRLVDRATYTRIYDVRDYPPVRGIGALGSAREGTCYCCAWCLHRETRSLSSTKFELAVTPVWYIYLDTNIVSV